MAKTYKERWIMLHDFTYYNPTKIHFEKNSMKNLAEELENYGENILLLYGKGAIKKNRTV